MKKIVAMFAMAALSAGALFAADFSVEYATKGSIYTESSTKAAGATSSTTDSRSFLGQTGYDDDSASCVVVSTSSDIGGLVADLDVDARDKSVVLDQVYGWMNFGNLQLTTGLWTSRYVNRVKEDAGTWANADFEKFKPGIVIGSNGKGAAEYNAYDVDNLTAVKGTGKISTALAYTVRPNDATYFMLKGVAVTNDWGGTGRYDSDRTYGDGKYDLRFKSGFAGELAFRADDVIDLNVVVKSLVRDELVAAVFVRPLVLGNTNLLAGFTYATDLADNGDAVDSNAYAFGIDLRARFALTDALALTTMNNLSKSVDQKAKDGKENSVMSLWNMISLAYKVSDALTVQLTGESYMDTFRTIVDGDAAARSTLGGTDLSLLAGVVYSFNENASFTAGIKYETTDAFANDDWKDNNATTSKFSIPFVFDVAL